jgi:UDP-N-acetylmuramoyl-L-alanyl-D-glutamate--2,6-diaminopimelate ligase
MAGTNGHAREIGDRRTAIQTAIAELSAGDILIIAGKGHETGQIIGDQMIPFDDAEVVREFLQQRGAA